MLKGFRRGRDRPLSHQIVHHESHDSEEIEDKIRSAVDYWMGDQNGPPPPSSPSSSEIPSEKKPKKHKSEKRLKGDFLKKDIDIGGGGDDKKKDAAGKGKGKEKKKRAIKLEGKESTSGDNADENELKLFGVPVEVAARRSDPEGLIPLPLRNAVTYLNEKGGEEEGLYRVPGSHNKYLEYRDAFDAGENVDFFQVEKVVQNVAMMVIKYLKDLPEPLYTDALQARLRKVLYGIKDKEKQKRLMKKTMAMLPLVNREIFRYLVQHFRILGPLKTAEHMNASILSWGISLGRMMGQLLEFLYESEEDLIPETRVFGVGLAEGAKRSHKRGLVPSVVRFAVNGLLVCQVGLYFSYFLFLFLFFHFFLSKTNQT